MSHEGWKGGQKSAKKVSQVLNLFLVCGLLFMTFYEKFVEI